MGEAPTRSSGDPTVEFFGLGTIGNRTQSLLGTRQQQQQQQQQEVEIMRFGGYHSSSGRARLSLVAATLLLGSLIEVQAAEFRHLDGIHRIAKQAMVTPAAVLYGRDDSNQGCATSYSLCAASLNGGCCPDGYECASESCYATTRGPSTCGTLVGWHFCDAVYGGGCCPDGYVCETAGACVPPSGSAYTQDCPASHFMCPSSLSYGCCPDGMACAINQCYSTEPTTVTAQVVITTTQDGDEVTITTTEVTVSTPETPTSLPSGDEAGAEIIKYYPSVVDKVAQSSVPDDNKDNGGLSTGALVGIVIGAVAFLVLVAVGAFIIIRHLNKVVAVVSDSKGQSDSSNSRSRSRPMRQYKPTDSDIDAFSVDPLMMSPSRANTRTNLAALDRLHGPASPDLHDGSTTDQTPSSFIGMYQPVSTSGSRHTSFDTGYFDPLTSKPIRESQQTTSTTTWRVSGESHPPGYTHARQWSNASDASTDGQDTAIAMSGNVPGQSIVATELEAKPLVPELVGSPPLGSPLAAQLEEARRRSASNNSTSIGRPPLTHQRKRSTSGHAASSSRGGNDLPGLGVVSEEIHGYYGPTDRMVGQTENHRPVSREILSDHGKDDGEQRAPQ